jgi:hypothetical protein
MKNPDNGTMLESGEFSTRKINPRLEREARERGDITDLDRVWLWEIARITWRNERRPCLKILKPRSPDQS